MHIRHIRPENYGDNREKSDVTVLAYAQATKRDATRASEQKYFPAYKANLSISIR